MKKVNFILLVLVFLIYPICYWDRLNLVNTALVSLGPSLHFLAGTDSLGRDYFLRCIQGTFLSVFIATIGLLISHAIGFLIGCVSVSNFLKAKIWLPRLIDLLDTLPAYLVVSVLAIFWQQIFKQSDLLVKSVLSLILSISLVSWMATARMIRLEILQLLDKEYILSSKIMGASFFELIQAHFIKHTYKVLKISMVQHLPHFILLESFLSYLGIGIVPPYLSLGALISEGWKYAYLKPHFFIFPSLFLVLISYEFKLILGRLKG